MGIYQTIYDLIVTYIFGSVTPGTYQDLVTIFLSSCAVLFVFSLPFIVVWRIIKLLV